MNFFSDKLKNAEPQRFDNNKSKSIQIGLQFECLTLAEKMELFNLPKTLAVDPEREKRISTLWCNLSEEEKHSIWANAFENIEKSLSVI